MLGLTTRQLVAVTAFFLFLVAALAVAFGSLFDAALLGVGPAIGVSIAITSALVVGLRDQQRKR